MIWKDPAVLSCFNAVNGEMSCFRNTVPPVEGTVSGGCSGIGFNRQAGSEVCMWKDPAVLSRFNAVNGEMSRSGILSRPKNHHIGRGSISGAILPF
ncbi:UNVERIFIED_ORG: hypothetical protein ABRZ91_001282 [Heyndrickxia coagulans]